MRRLRSLVLLAPILAAPLAGAAVPAPAETAAQRLAMDPVLESTKDAWVDWTRGKVYTWGRTHSKDTGEVNDTEGVREMTAIYAARDLMRSFLGSLRLDSEHTLGALEGGEEIVAALAEGARSVQKRVRQGRFLEIRLAVQFYGASGLFSALPGGDAPGSAQEEDSGFRQKAGREGPTGILIDARGTGLRPAVLPRILDPEGKVLWDVDQADPITRVRRGLLAYGRSTNAVRPAPSESEMLGNPILSRLGARPESLRAAGSAGPQSTDVVLDADSAARLAESVELRRLLGEARLVIMLD